MFGGCPKLERGKSDDAQLKLAKTTVLEFGEQGTYIILTLVVAILNTSGFIHTATPGRGGGVIYACKGCIRASVYLLGFCRF